MNILETRVLELIGEDVSSPDVFTDDASGMKQIRDSLNSGIEDVCLVTGSFERSFHIPLKANMMFYQITSNRDVFAWPKSVWLVDQKRRLDQTDLYWLLNYNPRFLSDTANPIRYFIVGDNKIGVHPTPSSSVDMLEINAVVIPDRYTEDTDRIKLRNNFQWGVVHYAVSEYYASRGDANSASGHFSKFLYYLGIQEIYPASHERQREYSTDKK
jgi:hypothetical protein